MLIDHIRKLLIYTIIVFFYDMVSTGIHESGHALAAIICGGKVSDIKINPFAWSYVVYERVPENQLLTVLGGVLICVLLSLVLVIFLEVPQKEAVSRMNLLHYFIVYLLLDNGLYLLLGLLYATGDALLWIKYGIPQWGVIIAGCLIVLAGFLLAMRYKSNVADWKNISYKNILLTLGGGLVAYRSVVLVANIIQTPERVWFWLQNFLLNGVFIMVFVSLLYWVGRLTKHTQIPKNPT